MKNFRITNNGIFIKTYHNNKLIQTLFYSKGLLNLLIEQGYREVLKVH